MRNFVFVLLCCWVTISGAQNSSDTLLFDSFFNLVKKNHPVVKLAGLQLDRGSATVMLSRGSFDPQAFSYIDNKFYNGKEYYNYANSGVKALTRTGIELKAGFEHAGGDFISPDETTPAAGLWTAGFAMPVLQGLWIDKQRAALREAKIYRNSTEAEKTKMVNDLLLQAGTLYWEWAALNNQLEVYKEAIEFSETRFNGIKTSFSFGDRPAIDTVETLIQLQNFLYSQNQTLQLLIQKTYELSVFTWDDTGNPGLLSETIKAPNFTRQVFAMIFNNDSLTTALNQLSNLHPDLRLYQFKMAQLEVEKKWKQEKLKPKLNVRYNLLSTPAGNQPPGEFSTSNYKWGAEFGMPVFLRNERADLKLTRIKMNETGLLTSLKQKEVSAKLTASYRKCEYLLEQIVLMRKNVENYKRMLDAERSNFDAGESSVFLVNSRELALVQAELKLIDSESKYRQAILQYYHAAGTLLNQTKF
jgi:outer membrane protein TolC